MKRPGSEGWWLLVLIAGVSGCMGSPQKSRVEASKNLSVRVAAEVPWLATASQQEQAVQTTREMLQAPLTVEAAIRIALLNNRGLQVELEGLGIAQADLLQAGLPENPEVEASVRTPTDATVPGDPLAPRTSTIDIDATQDVLGLVLLGLRKKVAAAEVRKVEHQLVQVVLDLKAEVQSAFYELQAAQQELALQKTILAAAEAGSEVASRLHQAGNLAASELYEEQLLHEQWKLEVAEAETDLVSKRERLAVLLGLWGQDLRFSVAEVLPELPAQEVPAEGLESRAVALHPSLAAASQEIEAKARALGLANASRWIPSLRLGVHFERETEGEWTLGPSMSIALPLFDQGQGKVARGQAELRQAQQSYVAQAIEVRSAVRAARTSLGMARAKAEFWQRNLLPLRQKMLQQAQLEYNAMQIGVFDLLQARQAEIEAGRQSIAALLHYWQRRIELERALGATLETAFATEEPVHDHTP